MLPFYILIATLVVLSCIWLNKISNRLGIPMLLAFIMLGMLFGSDGLFKIHFDNFAIAENVCSVALIFIMFYGGFGTKWSMAKPIAVKAILLSSVGVILTAGITGLFCYFALDISFLESFLIGSVISSTDAASVFAILRNKRLNLKYNTASMLEMESGSNDPSSYMLTMITLFAMNGKSNASQITYMIFAQVFYAIVLAVIIAYGAVYILKKYRFTTDGFDTIFVFAVALLSYAVPAAIGGNGYLSTYIVGIILGNCTIPNKKALVNFFDGVTGLTQMLIFFLLGLLAFPSQIPAIIAPAFAIAVFLTFVARPIAVFLLLTPFGCKAPQQLLVSWAGLRGAASIVFAVMATVNPAYMKNDVFHMVFCIVLFSIAFQGSLIPYFARKLNMIDDNDNVLKTFNDYSEEVPVRFIKLTITPSHLWIDKKIKDIALPPDTLLVLLLRNDEKILPNGSTIIHSGDILVLSAQAFNEESDITITEMKVDQYSDYLGLTVANLPLSQEKLVVMIKRNDRIIIPRGKTLIKENDTLVISEID